jgi:tRNA (cmo5U34)-methyltransferase
MPVILARTLVAVQLRVASLSDYPDLVDPVIDWHWQEWGLHQSDDPPQTIEQWRARLVRRSQSGRIPFTLVAFVDDEPVGCVTVCNDDKDARYADRTPWLSGMVVRSVARNLGVGRALVLEAEHQAAHLGVHEMWVWTTEAAPFYQRCGYQVVAKKETLAGSTVLRHDLREGQFHFNPATYADMVRAEVPQYETLQNVIGTAAGEVRVQRALELGTGTGETMRRVAAQHPNASLVGIDENDGMLAVAREQVPHADLRVSLLQDALPGGQFQLVFSALAVHHLDGTEKADLFRRIAAALAPGGRFVLGDLVLPDDPADVVTDVDDDYDKPSTLADQLEWLAAAGFAVEQRWRDKDLVVLVADKR